MRGLDAIIDPAACRLPPLAVAQAALRGGCDALQLRAKQLSDADFLTLGHALVRACRTASVPFFVNDQVWLASALGAEDPEDAARALHCALQAGTHAGQS